MQFRTSEWSLNGDTPGSKQKHWKSALDNTLIKGWNSKSLFEYYMWTLGHKKSVLNVSIKYKLAGFMVRISCTSNCTSNLVRVYEYYSKCYYLPTNMKSKQKKKRYEEN